MDTIDIIFIVMFTIYMLANISRLEFIHGLGHLMGFVCTSYAVKFMITCLTCGMIETKISELNDTLDSMIGMGLTDAEYKELKILKDILRQKSSFGFTIGGFASFNKSTLISVLLTQTL